MDELATRVKDLEHQREIAALRSAMEKQVSTCRSTLNVSDADPSPHTQIETERAARRDTEHRLEKIQLVQRLELQLVQHRQDTARKLERQEITMKLMAMETAQRERATNGVARLRAIAL